MGRRLGELGEKGERDWEVNWQLQNSHGEVQYSLGNIVSSALTTVWFSPQDTRHIGGSLHKLCK